MTPRTIPALFADAQLVVYKKIAALPASPARLFSRQADAEYCRTIEPDTGNLIEDDAVPVLMARRRIQELEESIVETGSIADRHEIQQAIIELSRRYGLISSLTSYIAIETRPDAEAADRPEYRRVPLALTAGWGGIKETVTDKCQIIHCDCWKVSYQDIEHDVDYSVPFVEEVYDAPSAVIGPKARSIKNKKSKVSGQKPPAVLRPPKIERPESMVELTTLIGLQRFDGEWPDCQYLRHYHFGNMIDFYRIRQLIWSRFPNLTDELIPTILALYLLESRFDVEREQWRQIAEKGRHWLNIHGISEMLLTEIFDLLN